MKNRTNTFSSSTLKRNIFSSKIVHKRGEASSQFRYFAIVLKSKYNLAKLLFLFQSCGSKDIQPIQQDSTNKKVFVNPEFVLPA